eukprot:SAG22_NODE_151_length_17414_cov_7.812128_9_plen_679_part_00
MPVAVVRMPHSAACHRLLLVALTASGRAAGGGQEQQQCSHPGSPGWGPPQLPPNVSYSLSNGLQPLYATPFWRYRGGNSKGQRLDVAGLKALADEIRAARPAGTSKSNIGGWQSPGNLLDVPWVAARPEFQLLVAEINRQARLFVDAQAAAVGGGGGGGGGGGRPGGKPPPPYRAKVTRLWANLNGFGDYNAPHTHSMCHFAGALYVTTGGDPGAALELLDPRPNLHGDAAAFVLDRRAGRPERHAEAGDGRGDWVVIGPGGLGGTGGEEGGPLRPWTPGRGRALAIEPGLAVLFPAWLAHWVHPHGGLKKSRLSFSFNIMIEKPGDGGADSVDSVSPPPLPAPAEERLQVAAFGTSPRETLRLGGRPGLPLPDAGAGGAADTQQPHEDGHGVLELGWPIFCWVAELGGPRLLNGAGQDSGGYAELAAAVKEAAKVYRETLGPQRKFKPNRQLLRGWKGQPGFQEEDFSAAFMTGEAGRPLRRAIYQQLGWAAAELCGAVDGLGPPPSGSTILSAKLLQSRPLALQAPASGFMLATPLDGAGGGTMCGLFGLRVAGGGSAWLLLHDPRPAVSFDPPHTSRGTALSSAKTLFGVRTGTLVLFPCQTKFDLRLESAAEGAAAESSTPAAEGGGSGRRGGGGEVAAAEFVEFVAAVEVSDRAGGGDHHGGAWLRVPASEKL